MPRRSPSAATHRPADGEEALDRADEAGPLLEGEDLDVGPEALDCDSLVGDLDPVGPHPGVPERDVGEAEESRLAREAWARGVLHVEDLEIGHPARQPEALEGAPGEAVRHEQQAPRGGEAHRKAIRDRRGDLPGLGEGVRGVRLLHHLEDVDPPRDLVTRPPSCSPREGRRRARRPARSAGRASPPAPAGGRSSAPPPRRSCAPPDPGCPE